MYEKLDYMNFILLTISGPKLSTNIVELYKMIQI